LVVVPSDWLSVRLLLRGYLETFEC
jgi:hypothetical protein